ncbi:hypothetical protein CA13_65890 [Planctomycetes bacterium CA13]|uniref:Probable zinc-binding domain-containing protein n=1 Tax=Novipirellula herctigrandis TaxID=2527986 RepID=A0A5C5ZDF8_9BACT|nr:hypothetical protein CA13_65890 [Planctomycetes bacterium CA13]
MTRRREKRKAAKPSNQNVMPDGAVVADRSRQVPNNSYDLPPRFYVDIEFKCSDCGIKEVWTGKQQKWFYEVAKGSLYKTAKRCGVCRNRIKAAKDLQREQMAKADAAKNATKKG